MLAVQPWWDIQPFLCYHSFHQPKQHHFSSSRCDSDMEEDGDMDIVESMMEDARHDFSGQYI